MQMKTPMVNMFLILRRKVDDILLHSVFRRIPEYVLSTLTATFRCGKGDFDELNLREIISISSTKRAPRPSFAFWFASEIRPAHFHDEPPATAVALRILCMHMLIY